MKLSRIAGVALLITALTIALPVGGGIIRDQYLKRFRPQQWAEEQQLLEDICQAHRIMPKLTVHSARSLEKAEALEFIKPYLTGSEYLAMQHVLEGGYLELCVDSTGCHLGEEIY